MGGLGTVKAQQIKLKNMTNMQRSFYWVSSTQGPCSSSLARKKHKKAGEIFLKFYSYLTLQLRNGKCPL